tara:strand:+ start:66 stop:1043 length:978 start_codon:yes stop_codon:yes gene_type:complete
MSKSKDFMSLGEAYKDVFKKVVINEEVPPGTSGEAPLTKGGPEEEGGFRKPLVDLDNMSDKDKKDNIYNIKGYSYGDGNDPVDCQEPKPTGPTYGQVAYTGNVGPEEDEEDEEKPDYIDLDKDGDKKESMKKAAQDKKKKEESEEDEEILGEHEKIARDGLNNFMSKTSVFDKLYNKVMVNENFGEDQEDITDIEALGIETDEVGGDEGEVTITISKECCEEIHAACEKALGVSDDEPDEDFETAIQYSEEDEEAVDPGSELHHTVNMGDGSKNKVGTLKTTGAAKNKAASGTVDPGSELHHKVNMGTGGSNKVGDLKAGSSAFE